MKTTVPRTPAANFRRNPSSPWRHLDPLLIGATIAVACLGTLMVYSATRHTAGHTFLVRQAIFLVGGIALAAGSTLIDYRRYRDVAPVAYLGCLGLLFLVLSPLGTVVHGSRSWFAVGSFQLQPAEFTKLAVILVLAAVVAMANGQPHARHVIGALALIGVPAGLILLQPDLGSTMVFGAIVIGVLLVAGTRPRHLAALGLVAVVAVISIFQLGFIESYQRDRLLAFANTATTDASYNAEQAQTAIGAGGLTGAGLFEGLQTKSGYVPYQQSDFIFTVV